MNRQKLLSYTRRAVDDFSMINEGDKIAIGISGGKDSLTMIHALKGLQRFYPKKFEVIAIAVDLTFNPPIDYSLITEMCANLDVPFYIVKTEIYDIVFNERKESNPCSLCSKMRKGALNDEAKALGCNKIALGHHKEDIVETMMMSLIYEGRFHTFAPVTYLERVELTAIRPLMYIPEYEIISFTKKEDLPVATSPCPVDKHTRREYTKELLHHLNKENPGVIDRMFTAIKQSTLVGWDSHHKRGQ